jgi:peptidoglycan-associated lipoprotein
MTIASPSEFVLVAFGEGGEATAKANVAVFDVPTATISALPAQVAPGATTVVRWSTENATTARVNGRNVALRGSENVTVNVASEFVIVATGAGGEATAKALVNTFAPPTANLSASEKSIERGQSSVLSWRTTNADRILLNGESVSSSGNRSVSPSQTENYLLTATGPGGRAEDRTSIAVTTPPAPVVAASPRLFRIHFDFDEWAIRGDAMDTMSQIASFMRQNPWTRMIVLGHTDARGSEDYNIVLGEERARSVRDYFLAQFGLDASRFTLESRGEAAPIAPNSFLDGRDNPDGRALNRRAEFIEIR